MTKKALIVIAIAILLPIALTLWAVNDYYKKNNVVAEYGGSVEVIEYDGKTLYMVKSEEGYNFRFGDYLGKVGDSMTGASLYRVKDDKTSKYYAIAQGAKRILYTESGSLIDGVKSESSVVTRIVFDNFAIEEKDADDIALILSPIGNKVSVDMSNYADGYKYYDLYVSYDSSAIVTDHIGRLIQLTEKEKWIFISPDALDSAEEEYGKDIENTVYIATLIEKGDLYYLLESYFKPADTENTSSAEE